MSDPLVSMDPGHASVAPGEQARFVVTITNPGAIVDGYHVEVLDEVSADPQPIAGPARWSQVLVPEDTDHPSTIGAQLSLYPNQRQDVVVLLSPGTGSAVPAGVFAFAVRVVSVLDPQASAVVEGTIHVQPVYDLAAQIAPVNSVARWQAHHAIRITNSGNVAAQLRMVPSDDNQALRFVVQPAVIEVPRGEATTVHLQVRPTRHRVMGQPMIMPFTVAGEPGPHQGEPRSRPPTGTAPPPVTGTFTRTPILTRTTLALTAVAAVAAVALPAYALFHRAQQPSAPPAPTLTEVAAANPTSLRLSWAPVPGASSYQLLHLAQGSSAVEQVESFNEQITSHVVTELPPDTRSCFQLRAVRGDVAGPPSRTVCVVTAS